MLQEEKELEGSMHRSKEGAGCGAVVVGDKKGGGVSGGGG